MRAIEQLLLECKQLKIQLWSEQGRLRYRAPQGVLTAVLREELSARKEELSHLLQKATMLPQVQARPEQRYEPFPLTDIQHAYWIGRNALFELSHVATHIYSEHSLQGVDLARLNRSWQQVIERHDMLRMVILPEGLQQILPAVPPYQITVYDLRGQTQSAVDEHLTQVRSAMSHQLLPAEQWPLFAIRATRLDETQSLLHLSMDALFADDTSMQQIMQDWVQFYENPFVTLPSLEISFRDYVLTAKEIEETDLYQRAQAYWQQRLASLPPAPELPLVQNAATLSHSHFRHYAAQLDKTSWQQIKQQAAHFGLTTSDVMLTAFAEVLTAWSKSPRFTLNLTLFNRLPLHPQINQVVGDFTTINLLAIDNSAAESFTMRAKRIQQQLWQDLDHVHYSGVQVLRDLARQQGEGQEGKQRALMPVVFTNVLNLAPAAVDTTILDELTYSVTQTPQVMLDCYASEAQETLYFGWNAVADLFPPGLLEAMLAAYQERLQGLAQEENSWTTPSFPLTPAAQLAQRADINATQAPLTDDCLHTLFLKQVAAHRTDVAVITPHHTLTYGELYQRANQIGYWLRRQGAKANRLVAVVMEKGWEQVVAVLGIHLAGAAYLPVDPTLPAERQHYLLRQGEVSVALTQSWLATKLLWPDGVEYQSVDTVPFGANLPALDPIQTPTDLAYVIYTSGSTGLPKGVVIDHRGAVNTVLDINRRFGVTADDRVLALSALNFDLSVYDIFGLLAVGGAIVLPDPELRTDPAHWLALMERHHVTVWNTVPALMQMLVDYVETNDKLRGEQDGKAASTNGVPLSPDHPRTLSSLQIIMLSGDWIPVTLPDRIRVLWHQVTIYGLGGATEASIWSNYYPIEQVDPTWPSIPYGKPLTNQSFQVLDANLMPRPVWVPGDLYIGGSGLALGYWKDEEKSQAKFIHHPHSGERLYKTGDLARYLPDGNLEFLGREDFQVKIRGHRIELGEIESALLQHPAIKEVVVSAVGDPKGNRQLVAYVVKNALAPNRADQLPDGYSFNDQQSNLPAGFITDPLACLELGQLQQWPQTAPHGNTQKTETDDWTLQLQQFLKEKLPDYMVPGTYVILDTFPLTSNGKVDRKALPVPALPNPLAQEMIAPRTPTEQMLGELWCNLLKLPAVNCYDDFFALGGDSLLVTQVMAHLRVHTQVTLTLRTLFEKNTIATLAEYIDAQQSAQRILAAGDQTDGKEEETW